MACDPYKRNPLIRMLWKTFGAVPVLPIQHSLAVYSVLLKEKGGFHLIGNLGELCAEGKAKEELLRIISAQDPDYIKRSEEYGAIDSTVQNDISWSTKLLAFQAGASLGMSNVHSWKILVPSYQSVAATTKFEDVVTMFEPNSRNFYFANHNRVLDLWIVTEVITAPYLEMEALDSRGGNVGVSLPAVVVPVQVDVNVGGNVGAHQKIYIRGPKTGSQVRPLPVAFRGWKCRFENGLLKAYKHSTILPDGPEDASAASGQSSGQQAEAHDNPYNHDHMQDFVDITSTTPLQPSLGFMVVARVPIIS